MISPYSHLNQVFQIFEPRILFAYIFGSTGTDSESSGSDLDIAVYFDMPPSAVELDHKLLLYAAVSRAMKRNDIDIVVLNTCTNQMLLYEIMTQGKLIFEVDFEVRALFEQQTLHQAIDFKQQRERIFG
jgi:predicted nucleotidyltransferase